MSEPISDEVLDKWVAWFGQLSGVLSQADVLKPRDTPDELRRGVGILVARVRHLQHAEATRKDSTDE